MTVDKKSFETTNCIVCDANDTDKISEKGQFGLPAHVVLCRQCGLSYLNPRWNKAYLTHFYKNEYDKYYRPEMDSGSGDSQYKILYSRLEEANFKVENMNNVLDIGSGDGRNLKYLIEKLPKAEFHAIEPSPICRDALKGIGVNILGTDVEHEFDSKYKGYFDLIIMRHVLEHFLDPIGILKSVKVLLKEDGILYIAVPNSLTFGKFKLSNHYFRSVHTYYFNIHSIKNVFNKAGIKVHFVSEGDQYNSSEMFAMVGNGEVQEVNINKENYNKQKDFFETRLKEENSKINRLKGWIKKVR